MSSAPEPVSPLRVLIVDDEPLARMRLRSLVDGNPNPPAVVVGEAIDADQALQGLASLTPDLLLLDVVMPGRNGLRLADELRRLAQPPLVVFVSAHGEHALQAFEVEALDYLTKPVRRERLQAALERAAQRLRTAQAAPAASAPVLVVTDRGRVLRIPIHEVLYLKADQKYVSLRSTQGSWLLDESLSELEQRLGEGFMRVHRNAVVALGAVRALAQGGPDGDDGWQVQLVNGDWLAVSRRLLPAVREVLAGRG